MKKDCPHGLKSEKGDVKKVSKVKAAKEQEKPEQGEKGVKDTTGGEESAKELGSPPTTSASSYRESPPRQSGTEAAAELLTEATSLLKTLRSVKVLRMKELKHKLDTRGGAVGLLDGGATNGLREALPHEIPRLEPVRVELASGSTTLCKVSEHRTLLSKEPEVIVPLHCLVALGYRLNWSPAGVSITHPEYGKIECALRGGCLVLPESEALSLLEVMEKADRGELMMDSEIRAWWASKFPEVLQETWEYMRGQMAYDPCLCPWNRHQRRRHQRSKGIILNLYSGKDTGIWSSKNWLHYNITMGHSMICTPWVP